MAIPSIPQPSLFTNVAPDPAGHAWRAFTLDTREEDASGSFESKYGRPPEYVFECKGLLLVGPVPEGAQ